MGDMSKFSPAHMCKSNGNGAAAAEVSEPCTASRTHSLRDRSQIPSHLQFNKYVLGHYRQQSDWKGCLHSLTYMHNETVNIMTHGVPILAILVCIGRILPWDEIDVVFLPYLHVFALLAPWIGSTVYHLFMNHAHGYPVYKRLLMADMCGIWIAQTLGTVTPICSTFYCHSLDTQLRAIVVYGAAGFYSFYKALTAKTPWQRRFSFLAPFFFRVLIDVIRLRGQGGGHVDSVRYLISQDLVAITGALIGATNIPERWFPGTLDLFFNSHHVMHVMVLIAAYQMHRAVALDLVWMTQVNAAVIPCDVVA